MTIGAVSVAVIVYQTELWQGAALKLSSGPEHWRSASPTPAGFGSPACPVASAVVPAAVTSAGNAPGSATVTASANASLAGGAADAAPAGSTANTTIRVLRARVLRSFTRPKVCATCHLRNSR